jgi:hypothetical protein
MKDLVDRQHSRLKAHGRLMAQGRAFRSQSRD